jgi:hypothetical protein
MEAEFLKNAIFCIAFSFEELLRNPRETLEILPKYQGCSGMVAGNQFNQLNQLKYN